MRGASEPSPKKKIEGDRNRPRDRISQAARVTAVELMPVHAFVDERKLVEKKLRNYWGYNSIGLFAPDMRYAATGLVNEFKAFVPPFAGRGDIADPHRADTKDRSVPGRRGLERELCFRDGVGS
jgi:hypothetical protein